MYEYQMAVKMSDKRLMISDKKMLPVIINSIDVANNSATSIRYNRKFSFMKKIDDSSILIKLSSRDPINPTRSLSTLSRAVFNSELNEFLKDYLYNGCVFNAQLVSEDKTQIESVTPDKAVAEIISIFFGHSDSRPKAISAARTASEEITKIVIQYMNEINEI